MSRIVDKQMLLTNPEKERFLKLLKKVTAFSGVKILSYALMGNHIHLIFMVPEKREYSEKEVIARIKALYGRIYAEDIAATLRQFH
jgi:REP element-mobilizing transposase RayT